MGQRIGFTPRSGRLTRPDPTDPTTPPDPVTPTPPVTLAGAGALIVRGVGITPGSWGLPPNLGSGYTQAFSTYDGSVLPNLAYGDSPNSFGMLATPTQAKGLSIVSSPDNPTGSGLMMRTTYPGPENPDWPEAFPPPDGGGRSPSARFNLATPLASYDAQELHVRMRLRWSAGWTEYGPAPTANTVLATVWAVSSTLNTITCQVSSVDGSSPGWATNQWVGAYCGKNTSGQPSAWRVISNTGNILTLRSGAQFGLNYSPNAMTGTLVLFTANANSNFGTNAGSKGWWPQLELTASGSGTVRGTGWSRSNVLYAGMENNFIGGWQSDGMGGGYVHPYFAPQMQDWNGTDTDGQGAVGINGVITYGLQQYFRSPDPQFAGVATGDWYDIEVYLRLSTPGNADGLYTVWINGNPTPVFSRTDVRNAPTYARDVVNVGGINYTVAVPVTALRFRNFFYDMTFGGGVHIPAQTQYQDMQGFQIFVK